jgi:hypothetical protein
VAAFPRVRHRAVGVGRLVRPGAAGVSWPALREVLPWAVLPGEQPTATQRGAGPSAAAWRAAAPASKAAQGGEPRRSASAARLPGSAALPRAARHRGTGHSSTPAADTVRSPGRTRAAARHSRTAARGPAPGNRPRPAPGPPGSTPGCSPPDIATCLSPPPWFALFRAPAVACQKRHIRASRRTRYRRPPSRGKSGPCTPTVFAHVRVIGYGTSDVDVSHSETRGSDWTTLAVSSRLALGVATSIYSSLQARGRQFAGLLCFPRGQARMLVLRSRPRTTVRGPVVFPPRHAARCIVMAALSGLNALRISSRPMRRSRTAGGSQRHT